MKLKRKLVWIIPLAILLLIIIGLLSSRGGRIVVKDLKYRTVGKTEINRHIEALRSTDTAVFKDAVERLVWIGNPAVPALLETLSKGKNEPRPSMRKEGKPHPPEEERGEHTRVYIIWILGKIGNKQTTPALIEALKDEHPLVRRFAAGALGDLKDEKAVPALLKTLKDEDEDVRTYAAWALEKIEAQGSK